MKPLAVDLCSGLGGWSQGLIAEGWDVVGFDIERHEYGGDKYPGQLVIQDIRTIEGKIFRGKVSLIVASPPCTEFSYMAMPWSRGKQIEQALLGKGEFPAGYRGSKTIAELTELFDACVRIGREAECPTIIENVRGAQKWVGRAKWAWGSFLLWGDVPALMPITNRALKNPNTKWRENGCNSENRMVPSRIADGLKLPGNNSPRRWDEREVQRLCDAPIEGFKTAGMNWSDQTLRGQDFTRIAGQQADTFGWPKDSQLRNNSSKRNARKAASATIAKIPLTLSRWIAKVYKPK